MWLKKKQRSYVIGPSLQSGIDVLSPNNFLQKMYNITFSLQTALCRLSIWTKMGLSTSDPELVPQGERLEREIAFTSADNVAESHTNDNGMESG